ncbi:hypothetical protein [Propionispira arboris]|uniref:hypothetical protein n=1 Tax=Propionispira arboris TaxID=84035 RepID=UPI001C4342CE|nr:hypothetical protein [Propionispira arboris]
MTSVEIVSVNVINYGSSSFFNIVILRQISFFILEIAKPSFNHNVISPTTFSIHILTDLVFLNEIGIFLAGKLAALIRIKDKRHGTINAFFKALIAILVSSVSLTSHPTIQRLYQSITAIRYKKPCLIGIYVIID